MKVLVASEALVKAFVTLSSQERAGSLLTSILAHSLVCSGQKSAWRERGLEKLFMLIECMALTAVDGADENCRELLKVTIATQSAQYSRYPCHRTLSSLCGATEAKHGFATLHADGDCTGPRRFQQADE